MTPELKSADLVALRNFAAADPVGRVFIEQEDDPGLANWFNAVTSPAVKAWRHSATNRDLFEATNLNQFNQLQQGPRDAWTLMINHAQSNAIDFRRNKMRNAISQIWDATRATAMCTSMTEDATRAEATLGGSTDTEATVAALSRRNVGLVSTAEASQIRIAT